MFWTMNASQEPGVKTSFQGWRMSLAEESLGCHFCRALDGLLRMGEYSGSRGACIGGSYGWIQEWTGTVSVSGSQFSTSFCSLRKMSWSSMLSKIHTGIMCTQLSKKSTTARSSLVVTG